MTRLLPWLALAGLSACGPMPVERAEQVCLARVQSPAPISGEIGMGVTTGGFQPTGKVAVNVGTRVTGDPSAVYDRCVYDNSGRMPTRPLYARTDWRG